MARPAPGPLPILLPPLSEAAKQIEHWANAPRMRLGDLSIRKALDSFHDGTPVWLTGSTVWMPAVYKLPPPQPNDVDLVFASYDSCMNFVQALFKELNRRIPGYTFEQGRSKLGAMRILFPEKREIISRRGLFASVFSLVTPAGQSNTILDAWALTTQQSIGEILMGYQADYQRCAYLMDRALAGSQAALTRIVRAAKHTAY